MIVGIADTHAATWYIDAPHRLSLRARRAFDSAYERGHSIGVSSISLAEVAYLIERGKIEPHALCVLLSRLDAPGSILSEVPFDRRVAVVLPEVSRTDVPDLPDRIIAATALYLGVPLISRDGRIRASAVRTVW